MPVELIAGLSMLAFLIIFGGLSLWFSARREKRWQAFAEARGMKLVGGDIVGTVDGIPVRIFLFYSNIHSKHRRASTVVEARPADELPPDVWITQRGMLGSVGHALGTGEELGVETFDRIFKIKTDHPQKAHQALLDTGAADALTHIPAGEDFVIEHGRVHVLLAGPEDNPKALEKALSRVVAVARAIQPK